MLTLPSAAEDALTVHRYLSTAFVARSKRIWGSRRMTRQALAQAEAWIAEFGTPPSDPVPLRRRQLVTLSTLERRLVDLSAAATQGAGVIVIDEADAALSPEGLAELGTVCDRLVQGSGSTLILVGTTLRSPLGTAGAAHPPDPNPNRWRPTLEPDWCSRRDHGGDQAATAEPLR